MWRHERRPARLVWWACLAFWGPLLAGAMADRDRYRIGLGAFLIGGFRGWILSLEDRGRLPS